jgi:mannobiose 2-epimerase
MSGAKDFDWGWFEIHLRELLDLIHGKTVTLDGLFHPHFDHLWIRKENPVRTLVSQSRLIYNFATGYLITGEERYRSAAEKGGDVLINYFKDRQYGGYVWSCDPEGRVLKMHKDCYGHAFVIFALSLAARALGRRDFGDEALAVWNEVRKGFRDTYGGYVWDLDRRFRNINGRRSQNPMMHLFEALLELMQLKGMESVQEEAWDLGDFVLSRLRRSEDGLLPEFYDRHWRELPEEKGGNVDVGHAFEWAFLLSRSCEVGLPECWIETGEMFLESGMRLGFDQAGGGVFSPASPDGKTVQKIKGWWEQCEAARALMHFAALHGRDDLWDPLQKTMHFIKLHMIDNENKGWYTSLKEGEDHRKQDKLDHWKLHYHTVGLCAEAVRLKNLGPA